MTEIKGAIIGNKTHITQPKFNTDHVLFFRKYLGIENIIITPLGTIINAKIEKEKLQMAVNAYEYEFGKWNK